MAIKAQNTTLYVSNDGTDYKQVGCIDSIGDIDFGEKSVVEIACLDTDNVQKVSGSMKLGGIDLSYVFNPNDTEGDAVIKAAFDSATDMPVYVRIELPDIPSGGSHGTRFEFQALVTKYSVKGFEKDNAIMTSTRLEITTKPIKTAAA